MYMAYTNNPNLPRVRMEAVQMVKSGKSARETARHFGFAHNTILNWLKRKPRYGYYNRLEIVTLSSRPEHHPNKISDEIIGKILELRAERNQCAEILHWRMQQKGILISLSSVKRILKRNGISKYSKWKKWHQYPERPKPEKPGILVEIDAVHEGINHRHTRVRTPTDNGHVERFIRSLQDECLHRIPKTMNSWKKEIPQWIHYYNTERPHMGLNMKTPIEVVRSY